MLSHFSTSADDRHAGGVTHKHVDLFREWKLFTAAALHFRRRDAAGDGGGGYERLREMLAKIAMPVRTRSRKASQNSQRSQ